MNLPLFAKYLTIYHFFETLKLDFMKIEFHELEYYEKNSIVLKFYQNISNFFHGTRVPRKTRFSRNQVSKK